MKKKSKARAVFNLWMNSDRCSKCGGKNIYYSLQKKVIIEFSPNGSIIKNLENGGFKLLKTQRDLLYKYHSAFSNAEIDICIRTCRDCDFSENVDGSSLEESED